MNRPEPYADPPHDLVLAITMGEPSGIGGELTIKSWLRRGEVSAPFIAIDNIDRISTVAGQLKVDIPVKPIGSPAEAIDVFDTALPVIETPLPAQPKPGELLTENAQAVIASIETATSLAKDGLVSGIVTNPIHKHNLYGAGFQHPGHTEFLADLAGGNVEPVMMLACDGLRTVPVTTHLSLQSAIDSLTTERIVSQSRIAACALETDFGMRTPRLAVAALNPHAGEDGAMGDEEHAIVRPAVERLRAEGFHVTGPHPPDTLFSAAMRTTYDVAICMYHDQALIPIKTLDFSGGVNVTLGLPFVRTSPDHGTALDIAGKGLADETSMIAALRLAAEIARERTALGA